MVKLEIKIKNGKQLLAKMNKYPNRMAKELQMAMAKVAVFGSGAVKGVITSGVDMWKSPIKTGQMRQGISAKSSGLRAEIKTSSRTPYAIYVHEGTRRMRKRPFMSITAKRKRKDIERFFNKAIENAIK